MPTLLDLSNGLLEAIASCLDGDRTDGVQTKALRLTCRTVHYAIKRHFLKCLAAGRTSLCPQQVKRQIFDCSTPEIAKVMKRIVVICDPEFGHHEVDGVCHQAYSRNPNPILRGKLLQTLFAMLPGASTFNFTMGVDWARRHDSEGRVGEDHHATETFNTVMYKAVLCGIKPREIWMYGTEDGFEYDLRVGVVDALASG